MNSLAQLAPLGLFSLLVAAACGTAPNAEGAGENVTASTEAVFSGVYGSISASPDPVYVAAAGDLGATTISWTMSQSGKQYSNACVYVQVNGATPKVVSCEPFNKVNTVVAPWLEVGNTYVFGLIPQTVAVQENFTNPVPWIASVAVEALVGETCTNPCLARDNGSVSCTGAICSVVTGGVTCDGATYECPPRDRCPTCDKR